MYKINDRDTYYMLLPPNLQDTDARCFSCALSKQIEKFVKLAEKLNLWGDLEHADERYYDYIAACMRVPYYRSEFDNKTKLQLIMHGYEIYRNAGTRLGVEDLINIIFEKAVFKPWDEYGGKQYHFKVLVYDILKEDITTMFTNVLQKAKAERSVMDSIEIGREAFGTSRKGAAVHTDIIQARIQEDNNDYNLAEGSCCTGATVSAGAKPERIEEDNSTSNTIRQALHVGTAQSSGLEQRVQEENSLSNKTETTIHAGNCIRVTGRENQGLKEDQNLENQTETTMYIAAEQNASADNIKIK